MFEKSLNWKPEDGYTSFSKEEKKVLAKGLDHIEKTYPGLTSEQYHQILNDSLKHYLAQVQDVLDREDAGFDVKNPIETDWDRYADYAKYKKPGDLYTKKPDAESADIEYEGADLD